MNIYKVKFLKAAAAATAIAIAIALTLCGCSSFSHTHQYSMLEVTLQPADIETSAGETVTFKTAAKGEGLNYQWYYKKPFGTWSVWKGHDTAVTSACANSTWNGMRVYCCITDSSGGSVATRAALISTENSVSISRQPADVLVNLGQTACFRIEAKGRGKLKYQWYFSKRNSVLWIRWNGHTGSSTEAVANNSWNGMRVCCLVTDSNGSSVLSDSSTVTVIDSPTVMSQPKNSRVSRDDRAAISVEGGSEGLVYQWFSVPSGAFTGVKMKGWETPELSLSADKLWSGAKYYCRLKSPGGSMTFSDSAVIVDKGCPMIISQPQPVAAMPGEVFKVSVKASGGKLRYQWYFRYKNSLGWFRLEGHDANEISLVAAKAMSGGRIRCEVIGGSGEKAISDTVEVSVNDRVNISEQPCDVTTSSDETVRLNVSTAARDAQFQWYARIPGSFVWTELAGQTGSEFVGKAKHSWNGMQIICRVYVPGGGSVFSRAATVSVNDIFALGASPENITVDSGENAVFAVKAKGRGLKYQWQLKPHGSDKWHIWEGQTSSVVELPAETSWHRMNVRCDVSDCTGRLISSAPARVWITDALDILRQPQSISVGVYEPAEFSVKAQGRGLRYQWYYKKRGMNGWRVWKKHTTSVTSALSNPTWDGMRIMCVVKDADGNKKYSSHATVYITK